MVRKDSQDVNDLGKWLIGWTDDDGTTYKGLREAAADLRELHDQSQQDGVTVDASAYADAQEEFKDALAGLINDADGIIDSTGVLEDADGNTLVDLPNAALARSQNKDIPNPP